MQVPGRLRLTHVKGLSFTGIRNLMGQHKTLATFLSMYILTTLFSPLAIRIAPEILALAANSKWTEKCCQHIHI